MRWIVLALGLTFPGVLLLLDCANRLALAVPLCAVGVGSGIVLGYYDSVVRRNSPMWR